MKHLPIYMIIAALLLTGCKKELDLDYHDIDPILVVEGNLTDSHATVSLTLTTPMDEPMMTGRLTDASVSITDLNDGSVTVLAPGDGGLYEAGIGGTAGHDYRLTVERAGKTYVGQCVMQTVVELRDIRFQWIKMPYDEVAVMAVVIADNPATPGDAYWVRIFRNDEVYKWVVTDDRFAVDGQIEVSMMTTRKNPSDPDDEDNLSDGDILTVSVTRIPAHVQTYLTELSAHTIAGPTTFSGDFCLGYFLAAPSVNSSVTFRPDSF